MSKVKTTPWGLKFGHPTVFRRTVTVNAGQSDEQKYQLVFEPNVPANLTEHEFKCCQDIIDIGLLVPWDVDPKGRRARPNQVARMAEVSRIQELELEVAALEEQVALLIDQVKELGGEPVVEAAEATDDAADKSKPKRGPKKAAAE